MSLLRGAFLMLLVLTPVGAMAEVYRWKDSTGRVHFGDRPTSAAPGASEKVHIRAPNLAKSLKASPNASEASDAPADEPAPGLKAVDPVPAPGPAPASVPRGGVVASQARCQTKKAAYAASRACFDACGRPNGYLGGRNTAGCGHCNDLPRPNC